MIYILRKKKDLKYEFREIPGYLSGCRAKYPKGALECLREVMRRDNYAVTGDLNIGNTTTRTEWHGSRLRPSCLP